MKKIFITLLAIFAVSLPMMTPSPALVMADTKSALQGGACSASGQANCDPTTAPTSIDNTIATVLNLLSTAAGVLAVVMVIVAGFRYMTSGGDSAKVTSAKNALMYAVIGLVIVAFSQLIVKFVLHKTVNTADTSTSTSSSTGSGRTGAGTNERPN
jgi:hypothetical protein